MAQRSERVGGTGAEHFSWSQIQPGWLVLSALAYLVGTLPSWLFWHKTLEAMGQRPQHYASLRAYYIGHLGKYVPGKALVVILRAGLVRGPRVDTTVAATAVFVETLTTMAVGGFVAAASIAILHHDEPWLLLLAVGLLVSVGIPTLPPVFRRIVRLLGVRKFNPNIDQSLAGVDYRLMAYGWLHITWGWCVLGVSLWATLKAIPTITAIPVTLADWPVSLSCYALAMLAGFVAMVPGGLGVREWVVMTLLAKPFGAGAAIVSAVLVRLMTLLAEALFAAGLYLCQPGINTLEPPSGVEQNAGNGSP